MRFVDKAEFTIKHTKKMKEAAENLEFEEAVIYRDKLKALEKLAIEHS